MQRIQVSLEPIGDACVPISQIKSLLREAKRYRRSIFLSVRKRGARYLGAMRVRAIQRLSQAQLEVEQIRARASEQGRSEGYRIGLESGKSDCLELVLRIAREVVGEELSLRPEVILKRIERDFRSQMESGACELIVPLTLEARANEYFGKRTHVKITPEEKFVPGEVRLESRSGAFSLCFDEYLNCIGTSLRGELARVHHVEESVRRVPLEE
ncbi:MAG: hypothetical protein KDD64_11640 [Bdellovibrionales bacterium]|nr:hypothetical protein [Bdellovibrionales bacterium]